MKISKSEYKEFKQARKAIKAYWATREDQMSEVSNGVSVAFVPMLPHAPEGRMVAVAVSYCAIEDTYNAKYGKTRALEKLLNGEFVQLPLAQDLLGNDPVFVKEYLLDLFDF